jgi:signal transduction histidine kinase
MSRRVHVLSLSAGLAVLGVTLFGLFNLSGRPGLPKEHLSRPIVGVDSVDFRRPTDLAFVLSRRKVGDEVEVRFGPDGGPASVRTVLVPYYSQTAFPLVYVLMGGFSFLAGFGVFLFKPRELRARIFYWLSLSFGAAVIIGGSNYGIQGRAVNVIPGILFNIAYPMTVAVLLRFALSYSPPRRLRPALFWALPAAWGVFLTGAFLFAQLGPSLAAFRFRKQAMHVFRIYIVLMAVAALVELGRAFRHASSEEDRTQIKWYLIGLLAGLGPFLVFYQLPLALRDRPLLSEDLASIFFFLLPIFMAMAILQFRLLRVNVVFHRGLVYALFTVFILCAYLFSVEALHRLFPRTTAAGNALITVAAILAVALAFSPGRKQVQDFVDRLFFRQAHEYRRAIREFEAGAPSVVDAGKLISLFTETLKAVLPVDRVGVVIREEPGRAGEALRPSGLDAETAARLEDLPWNAASPWARPDQVRGVDGLDFGRDGLLAQTGLALVRTMPRAAGTPAGLLAFGPKVSGHRLTREDVELIETLAGALAVNLGRIRIQEQVIYERASREKTEELVRLKTEFISSVSHELRTPMTSLRGLSELLRSGRVADEARREELLGLMAGECGRLTRFLTNVLDFGKIEGDAKTYDMTGTDLVLLVREVAELVRGGHPRGPARLKVEAPEGPLTVRADPDAVRQALLNIIDNAIKYSPDGTEVTVRLTAGPEDVTIAVRDRGPGVAAGDRDRIFEAFFRSPGAAAAHPAGVGLGLKIVKHIMAAHGGRVSVASEPGQGSTFSLVFPRG